MEIFIKTGFDSNGNLIDTDYWDSELCKNGFYYMAFNNGVYSLLIPEAKTDILDEIRQAHAVVITKGNYKERRNCFEIMFDDSSETPFMMILESEQVLLHPTEEHKGWKGIFIIYIGDLRKKCQFDSVYYRTAENIPFLKPPEEPQDWGEPVVKIDKTEHFEAHGDKWEALKLEDAENMSNVITTCIENGTLLENHVFKDPKGKRDIFPLVYPNENDIKVCTLNVNKGKNLSLDSMFPLMKGIPNEVTIEKTHTWKNRLEGEVAVDMHGFDTFFFAPFYKQEFKEMKKGNKVKVYLSALAYSVEKAMMKFEVDKGPMYEMQLREFLEKNPKKTKSDFKNPIVHMDGLVVFFPTKYYSEYEYRGTILSLENIDFFGKKVAKTKVCIKRDEDRNDLMYINLYIPLSCCKGIKLKEGMDIQGLIWLQGYCVELP